MSSLHSAFRLYTKDTSPTTYHHGVDDDVVLDVWRSYLREWTKTSNNNDVIKICKPAQLLCASHSIPSKIRSEIWFVISGAKQLMKKHAKIPQKTYKYLSSQEDTKYTEQINKDYERTFVTKDLPNIRQKIQYSLRRMLIGYANYNPTLGYAQGMNMICAFILRQFLQHDEYFNTNYNMYHIYHEEEECKELSVLSSSFTINADTFADNSSGYNSYARSSHSSLVLECDNNEAIIEEQAFWCFVCVMTNITTLFEKKLAGYHKAVKCFINMVSQHDNELFAHFNSMGIDTLLTGVFIKWFTSLFAYPSFNLNTTQKLWDIWFLYEFDFAVFIKFAFLMFENHKHELLRMDDIEIPVFCISSQCVVNEKTWMLKISKLKIAAVHLGSASNKVVHNINNEDDDEKSNYFNEKNVKLAEIRSIAISGTRSEQSYGEYRVDIKCINDRIWSLWKRYSEFERLYHRLKLFGIESDSQCQFPSKSWLFASNNESLMRSRQNILNDYLKNVLKKYNEINNDNNQSGGALQILHEFVNYLE